MLAHVFFQEILGVDLPQNPPKHRPFDSKFAVISALGTATVVTQLKSITEQLQPARDRPFTGKKFEIDGIGFVKFDPLSRHPGLVHSESK